VADADVVLASPDRLRAYMQGMRLTKRDSSRYDQRLRASDASNPSPAP
jgi:hypothetical protein